MKINFLFFFTAVITMFLGTQIASADVIPNQNIGVYANYAVAYDATTNQVLYDKNANSKWYPASITKLMTAILMEKYLKKGEMLTASQTAVNQSASNSVFLLKLGEKIDKENALHALLMISSNDVAEAAAEKIAGNDQNFAKLMNQEAKELGTKNTHFVDPNGLFNSNHYTTTYDMALITEKALQYPDIVKVIGTKTYTIHTNERSVTITNQNKILGSPELIGGKMGYTSESGNSLMEAYNHNGHLIIIVVMQTTLYQEYTDVEKIKNYVFGEMATEQYQPVCVVNTPYKSIRLYGKDIELLPAESFYTTNGEVVQEKVKMLSVGKTFKKGENIANLELYQNGSIIKTIPLMSNQNVTEVVASVKTASSKKVHGFTVFLIVIVAVIAYFVLIQRYNMKKKRKLAKKRG